MILTIIKRIGINLLTLLIIIVCSYYIMKLAPGNPYEGERNLTPTVLEALKKKYDFSVEQARTYLGLKQNTRTTNLIEYDGVEPTEGKTLEEIIRVAETYFQQFL